MAVTFYRDTRIEIGSNCFYLRIPKGHATTQIPVWYHIPENFCENMPIVIVLHGTSRRARATRDNWQCYAYKNGFCVLVPEFERDFFTDQAYAYGNFFVPERPFRLIQWNRTNGKILDLLFNYVRNVVGSNRQTFTIYGHSAGAQFAHRYLMLASHNHVGQAILANAGWYTLLDRTLPLPFGIGGAALPPNRLENLLKMPITILLGEKDTVGPYSDWWPPEHLEQGPHRLARGKNFYLSASHLAKRLRVPFGWTYKTVNNVGHENKKMIAPAVRLIRAKHCMEIQDNSKFSTV